jgi:hypothetical protein
MMIPKMGRGIHKDPLLLMLSSPFITLFMLSSPFISLFTLSSPFIALFMFF